MFERAVIPGIIDKFSLIKSDSLHLSCFLICESRLEDVCVSYGSSDISWGTRIEEYRISLYLQGGDRDSRMRFAIFLQDSFEKELIVIGDTNAAEILSVSLRSEGKVLCAAESITGGLIARLITDIPGSSKLFWGSLVTYSNSAKQKVLGIKEESLNNFGAVSGEIVKKMSERVLELAGADISLAVSGYAGGGGDPEDTGVVWIAVKLAEDSVFASNFVFTGSRD